MVVQIGMLLELFKKLDICNLKSAVFEKEKELLFFYNQFAWWTYAWQVSIKFQITKTERTSLDMDHSLLYY